MVSLLSHSLVADSMQASQANCRVIMQQHPAVVKTRRPRGVLAMKAVGHEEQVKTF
jgi:hypothetical protein